MVKNLYTWKFINIFVTTNVVRRKSVKNLRIFYKRNWVYNGSKRIEHTDYIESIEYSGDLCEHRCDNIKLKPYSAHKNLK